jgi:hypothetical protein
MFLNGAMIFAEQKPVGCYTSGPHRRIIITRLPRTAGLGDNTKLHNDPYACFAATA